jgi:hypothetical protein
MKYLLVLLMLVSTAVFAVDKDIQKLEDSYIEKSRKLTESYVAALKQLEVRVTKKGDLDSAIKVRNKIAEMEALLNGLPKPEPKEIPKPQNKVSILGKWLWDTGSTVEYKDNGTVFVNNKLAKIRWKSSGVRAYKSEYVGGGVNHITLSADGNTMTIVNADKKRFKATRIIK